jgi:hypothetical protein
MTKDFDIYFWNVNSYKLKDIYPQLTDADLVWRHETQDDLYRMLAETLGVKKQELEETIEAVFKLKTV